MREMKKRTKKKEKRTCASAVSELSSWLPDVEQDWQRRLLQRQANSSDEALDNSLVPCQDVLAGIHYTAIFHKASVKLMDD